jgi:ABC-type dipeptide/oligopeptide/nickel transport system permease component
MDELGHDYVRTARAKGIGRLRIIVVHGMRNALIPVVTVIGIQFSRLLGGAVVVERVFSLPGLGSLAISSVLERDVIVIQGIIMVFAIFVVSANFIVDLSYGLIDPRIRRQPR